MNLRFKITCILVILCASQMPLFAAPQNSPSKKWSAANYHGLVVGKSTRKDILRVFGKPKWKGIAADSDVPFLGFEVTDPLKGRLEVYFQGPIIGSMALYPDGSPTTQDAIRIFGANYLLVRYSADDCPGTSGAGPMYEDPKGDIRHMEYREKGIAVMFQRTQVEVVLYVHKPFGPTKPRCKGQGSKP